MHPARHLSRRPQVLSKFTTTRLKSSTPLQQPNVDNNNILRSPFPDFKLNDLNLGEYLWGRSEKWKNWPALTCAVTGRSYTYSEARAAAERLSISLPASAGLRPGDTVGLVLPNMPEFSLTLLGATAAGLVISPANPVYTPEELARQFADSGARAVVTTPALLDKVRAALDMVPGGAQIIVATDGGGAEEAALASQPHASSLLSLHEMLRREYTRHTPRAPRSDPDSLAILPYSSGTTGIPKGVRLTHRNMVANIIQMKDPKLIPAHPDGLQDISLAVLPFFHILGLNGVIHLNLSLGRHSVCLPRFEPSLVASAFARYKPTTLVLVPPLLMFLTATDKIPTKDLQRVNFIACGAAPTPKVVIENFMKRTQNKNFDIREGYGMTETCGAVLFSPIGSVIRKIGSCGVPMSNVELKFVDQEGEALPAGQKGEMWIRGPQNMQSYHNNDLATSETMTDDGWIKSGDVGYYDDEGFVYIVDRIKELIKVKGLQVSPSELESVLRQMDEIADVAVVGVSDDRAGQLPRAYVVRRPNCDISEKDIKKFVEKKVAPFKRLEGGVKFVKEIPKNPGGKILRKALKNLE